jgi:hypothetical protein
MKLSGPTDAGWTAVDGDCAIWAAEVEASPLGRCLPRGLAQVARQLARQ